MHWQRLGRIFAPDGRFAWMKTHAASPYARRLAGNRYRVYCSGRDDQGRARVSFFEIDITRPKDILAFAERPVIELGPRGTFDDNGQVMSCMVKSGDREFVYYSGWTLGHTVPFWFFTGLAISTDGGITAERYADVPVLDRSRYDPFLTGGPWVMQDEGRWRMWYIAGTAWETLPGGALKHYYRLQYAESHDGIQWERSGVIAIGYDRPEEYAFARPCVLRDSDAYRMWYAFRGDRYQIGYAESPDGLTWTRRDEHAGLMRSSGDAWDSEMVEYPFVFDHDNTRYMLYCGNGYGLTGIGLAVLEA